MRTSPRRSFLPRFLVSGLSLLAALAHGQAVITRQPQDQTITVTPDEAPHVILSVETEGSGWNYMLVYPNLIRASVDSTVDLGPASKALEGEYFFEIIPPFGGSVVASSKARVTVELKGDPSGRLDTSCSPLSFENRPRALWLDEDGILVGGAGFGGEGNRRPVLRLKDGCAVDATFQFRPPNASGSLPLERVNSIVRLSDGSYVLGGVPNPSAQGFSGPVVRVGADGLIDTNYAATARLTGSVSTLLVSTNDEVFALGALTTTNGSGTVLKGMVELNRDGTLSDFFVPVGLPENSAPKVGAQRRDGSFIVAGVSGIGGPFLTRVGRFGSAVSSFEAPSFSGMNGFVQCLALDASDRILVGGGFSSVNALPLPYMARLLPNGLVDATFRAELPFGNISGHATGVSAIKVRQDGTLLVGTDAMIQMFYGAFVGLLRPDGSRIHTFDLGTWPGDGSKIDAFAEDADGSIWVSGGNLTEDSIFPQPGFAPNFVRRIVLGAGREPLPDLTPIATTSSNDVVSTHWRNQREGFIATAGGEVLRTTDRGLTWQEIRAGSTSVQIAGPAVFTAGAGTLSGGIFAENYSSELVTLAETNGIPGLQVLDQWFASSTNGVAVGLLGEERVLVRFNGQSWTLLPLETGPVFRAVAMRGEDVWLAGDEGALGVFRDGQLVEIPAPTAETLRDIAFVNGGFALAVGDRGSALRFDSEAWSAIDTGTTNRLNAVTINHPDQSFAVGDAGTVLEIRNGGASVAQFTAGQDDLLAVDYSENSGFIGASNGKGFLFGAASGGTGPIPSIDFLVLTNRAAIDLVELSPVMMRVYAGNDILPRATVYQGLVPIGPEAVAEAFVPGNAVDLPVPVSPTGPGPAYLSAVLASSTGIIGVSPTLRINLLRPPEIVTQPASRQVVLVGQPVEFSVEASGPPPLAYQWFKASAPIDGATNSVLHLASATETDSGVFTVQVSGPYGATTRSGSTLVVLTGTGAPRFLTQPVGANLNPGDSWTLAAEVQGLEPIGYQWFLEGAPLLGATNGTLSFTNLSVIAVGRYHLVASNRVGSVSSQPATLWVQNLDTRIVRLLAPSRTAVNGSIDEYELKIQLVTPGGENRVAYSLLWNPEAATNFHAFYLQSPFLDLIPTDLATNVAAGLFALDLRSVSGEALPAGVYDIGSMRILVDSGTSLLPWKFRFADSPFPGVAADSAGDLLPVVFQILSGETHLPVATAVDPQTGLFTQKVTVQNSSATAVSVARLYVFDAGIDSKGRPIRLHNATGSTNGVPYVEFGPVAEGSSLEVLLEYFVPDRTTRPNPRLSVDFGVAAPAMQGGTVLSVERIVRQNNQVLVEFSTDASGTYFIQYQDGIGADSWQTSLPGIVGTGSKVQWIDNGPPRTATPPTNSLRIYRLLRSP